MSAVETIRDIPVIIEHRKGCAEPTMDVDGENGGYPFDRRDRQNSDDTFRHQLDDIAQRHPELAEHLQAFPRRGSNRDNDEFLRRRFERPFGTRFERFGFPFDRENFDQEPQNFQSSHPEYFQQPQQEQQPQQASQQQFSQNQAPQSPQNQQPQEFTRSQSTQTQGTQTDDSPIAEPDQTEAPIRSRQKNIQQSNTCDLTQKQEPEEVNDRGQRSMSAPPENRQRFISSVNIPVVGNRGTPTMHESSPSSAKPQGSTSGGITERVIPIHVEGRDDPIIPKNFTASSSSPQPEKIFTDASRPPQPDRIFGQRPEQFTQYVREPRFGAGDWHHPGFDRRHVFPEDEFMERSSSPIFAQRQQQQQTPPAQQQAPSPQPKQEQQQQPPKPQPAAKQPQTPIDQIQAIQKDVSELLKQVEEFDGAYKDKKYLFLDEMLTRNLLKLDNVDTQGQDAIRSARKEAIKCIERAIGVLEAKASSQTPKVEKTEAELQLQPEASKNEESMETEAAQEAKEGAGAVEQMETSQAADSKSDAVPETPEVAVQEKEEVKEDAVAEKAAEDQGNIEEVNSQQVESEKVEEPKVAGEEAIPEDGTKPAAAQEKKEKKKIKKKKEKDEKDKKQQ